MINNNYKKKDEIDYMSTPARLREFCLKNRLWWSDDFGTVFFEINGVQYIINDPQKNINQVEIHADIRRVPWIYNAIKSGKKLDDKGREVRYTDKEIKKFCIENNIEYSTPLFSFYFEMGGENYMVSEQRINTNIKKQFDENGKPTVMFWHSLSHILNSTKIIARKGRLIDIYQDLKNGYELDMNGERSGCHD